jgi:hypothetical protein
MPHVSLTHSKFNKRKYTEVSQTAIISAGFSAFDGSIKITTVLDAVQISLIKRTCMRSGKLSNQIFIVLKHSSWGNLPIEL